jgi:large subunit ribosomal protein L31
MKEGIHPKYQEVTATCVCGNAVVLGSTKPAIRVEICSACHPFYTGQQKIVDTEGRVDRFVKRYKLDKDKVATP